MRLKKGSARVRFASDSVTDSVARAESAEAYAPNRLSLIIDLRPEQISLCTRALCQGFIRKSHAEPMVVVDIQSPGPAAQRWRGQLHLGGDSLRSERQ
jgi:hypothetical protein